MIGLVTQQARAAVERADAEMAEKGAWSSGARPQTPHVGDHAGYGPIAQALDSHGVARTQVYEPQAQRPAALTTLHTAGPDSQLAGLASSISSAPGQAGVQHLDFTHGGTPQRVSVNPTRPAFTTAPTGAIPTQPRGTGNAALTTPGARS
jgi:hypothetical protein